MGFRKGAYAKVWEIFPPEEGRKSCKARISISRKDKSTGEYRTDFSDYVWFIGAAANKAQQLTEGSRIQLGDVDVDANYNKEKGRMFYSSKIFEFDVMDSSPQTPAADEPQEGEPKESTADYPF